MAKKKAKAAGPKNFPKDQGEDGAPDRFIPPDRADQIPNEDDDRPTVIQVKDLAEDLEIVEGDDDDERPERVEREERASAADDDAPETFEDEEGEEEEERGSRRNGSRGGYSRRVRARINRERSLTSQQRIRADNAERRAKTVEDRLAKLERVSTEVAGSQQVKDLEAKILTLKTQLEESIEKGATKDQLDLTIKLGDAQGELRLAKRDLEDSMRKQVADEAQRKKEREEEDARVAAADNGEAGEGDPGEWIKANGTWWGKPKFARHQAMAVNLDKEINSQIADGELEIEKYSDEHLELLNERLAKLYPDLPLHNADGEPFDAEAEAGAEEDEDDMNSRDRDRDDRRDNRSSSRRPPVGGQGSSRSGRRQVSDADLARQGKVRLKEGDFTQMRMYGLDPKKPEHKKRFAKERMRTILTDARRAERGTGARR